MKRYLAFLTIALALVACKKAQPTGEKYLPAPVLTTSTGTVQFDAKGGENSVTVTTNQEIKVYTDQTWLDLNVKGHTLTLVAEPNTAFDSRYASILVKAGDASRTVQVIQFGFNTKYLWEEEYEFPAAGGSLNLLYDKTDATVRVKVEEEWISAVPDDGVLAITVAQNTTAEEREGIIRWTAGNDKRSLTIKQAKGSGSGGGGDNPGGSVLFSEDFENEDNMTEWRFLDLDGDGYNWEVSTTQLSSHSGSGMLYSQSYINNIGALEPDNWAFTPAISFTSGNFLSFWVTAQDQDYYAEHYAVYITEALPQSLGDLDAMTKLHEATYPGGNPAREETIDEHVWQQFVIAIPSSFANKTGYIVFRHFDCTDMYFFNLDDVMVTKGQPSSASVNYAPAPANRTPSSEYKRK